MSITTENPNKNHQKPENRNESKNCMLKIRVLCGPGVQLSPSDFHSVLADRPERLGRCNQM